MPRPPVAVLFCAALLAGCASVPLPPWNGGADSPRRPGEAPGSASPRGPGLSWPWSAPPSPLATEQRWLQDWFRGTPVRISSPIASAVQAVQLEVPLEHSFEPGRSRVKPALAAVVDKVADSLLRHPQARLALGVPAGPEAAARLGSLRREFQRQDISATRIDDTDTPPGQVLLRLLPPPARPD